MSTRVCLSVDTIGYPEGGGHMWAYLNWALSLRSLGCDVLWMECVRSSWSHGRIEEAALALQDRLRPFGMEGSIVLCPAPGKRIIDPPVSGVRTLEEAAAADLLLNLRYSTDAGVVARFRRTALLDIDPGLLQLWMTSGQVRVAPHDRYFTIGETVGKPGSPIPDAGLDWRATKLAVALDQWPRLPSVPEAPMTTVTHWYADEWVEDAGGVYANDKRTGFLPFLDIARASPLRLELALCLGDDPEERQSLADKGWSVVESAAVTSTPADYRRYIQQSRGEFSCAKPSCIRLQNAWISDRTVCYLATGRPAVVQHTGPSSFLPDAGGLLRFRNPDEALQNLRIVADEYDRHCDLARSLAEEYFDGRQVARRLLEQCL
jgi:hypothetical protein